MELTKLIDELATVVLTVDATSLGSLAAVVDSFAELAAEAGAVSEKARQQARAAHELVTLLAEGQSADVERDLERLTATLLSLQQLVAEASLTRLPHASRERVGRHSTAPRQQRSEQPEELKLPAEADDEIFGEFLGNLKLGLSEMGALILELRQDSPDSLAELRRRIHTLKGEAGVLGLNDMEQVCHALESLLESAAEFADLVDPLLETLEWLERAQAAYARRDLPFLRGHEFAARLLAPGRLLASSLPADRVCPRSPDHAPRPSAQSRAPALCVGAAEPVDHEAVAESTTGPVAQSLRAADGAPPVPTTTPRAMGEPRPGPTLTAREEAKCEAAKPSLPPASRPSAPADDEPTSDAPRQSPLAAVGQASGLSAASMEQPGYSPDEAAGAPKVWDSGEIELLGQFLDEAREGMLRVDQTLLQIEQNGADAERINRLFRVFHTIKGVSGFLELAQITELAHVTETMLDQVRSGQLEPRGSVLDLVFDATAMMRSLLADLPQAVEQSRCPRHLSELTDLLVELRMATVQGCPGPGLSLPAEPGERVGEILVKAGVVTEEQIANGLVAQRAAERPLGELLIAQGQVPAKLVAQALRGQNQARQPEAAKIREVVKVDLERVDYLVETIGELVIVESMVSHAPEIRELPSHLRNYLGQFAKITRELQEIGTRMRMVPVRSEFQKMTRLVRDLSRKQGKEVRVEVRGEGTEMDRSMVEQIADPLVHLIRNAVDHGLEPAAERIAAGKAATGTILISAAHEGGTIVIEIADDGRGIDRAAVIHQAIGRGIVRAGAVLSDAEVFDLIFAPGFSTAAQVTEISGRGVGMDVVKRNVEAMRGRILTESVPGRGTTFRLVLPLTLAIIDGMVIRCGTESLILPTQSILESLKPSPQMLSSLAGERELIVVRGETLPLLRLDRLLDVSDAEQDTKRALVVIVETLSGRVGLIVDEVLAQQQVVIKSVGAGFYRSQVFSGAAILASGRVGLIINVEELVTQAGVSGRASGHHRSADEVTERATAQA